MKKTKIIMPVLAFSLALFGAFVFNRSNANAALVPGFYYNPQGHCSALPFGSCNNFPSGSICRFDDGTGYSDVYERQASVPGHGSQCDVVLRHSLNGGMIN